MSNITDDNWTMNSIQVSSVTFDRIIRYLPQVIGYN